MAVRLKIIINAKNEENITKSPQIKHFPYPKYLMMYRPDLHNFTNLKKTVKNVTKN